MSNSAGRIKPGTASISSAPMLLTRGTEKSTVQPTPFSAKFSFVRSSFHRTGRREDQGELASDDPQEDVHVQQAWVQQRSIVIERSERLRAGNGGQMLRRTRRAGRCPPGEWHI
jgi:hypothetical protein